MKTLIQEKEPVNSKINSNSLARGMTIEDVSSLLAEFSNSHEIEVTKEAIMDVFGVALNHPISDTWDIQKRKEVLSTLKNITLLYDVIQMYWGRTDTKKLSRVDACLGSSFYSVPGLLSLIAPDGGAQEIEDIKKTTIEVYELCNNFKVEVWADWQKEGNQDDLNRIVAFCDTIINLYKGEQ